MDLHSRVSGRSLARRFALTRANFVQSSELVVILGCLLFGSCTYSWSWRSSDTSSLAPEAGSAHGLRASRASSADEAPARLPQSAQAAPRAARSAVNPTQRRASGDEADCHDALRRAGVVFEAVPKRAAPGVAWPIELTSSIDGVRIHGGKPGAPTSYLDCRLARALLTWTPSLRDAGVVGLQHYSMYRKGAVVAGSNQQSGHALGWAIDVARFELSDGRSLSVLNDWDNRARGAEPCRDWPTDDEAAKLMRSLVCKAVSREAFQTVLTPHYNDAHRNHVHLEVDPSAESAWIG